MLDPNNTPWTKETLLSKAKIYAEEMHKFTSEDWQFGLYSSLSLEFLSRAALAAISPILLADQQNWRNLLYAIGHDVNSKKFTPNSIGIKECLSRINELNSEFNSEVAGFCAQHIERRNAELHTGESAFISLDTSSWLPKFYNACSILIKSLGQTLNDLMPDATKAQAMIESLKDEAAKAVDQEIKAYLRVWQGKTEDERSLLREQAALWATRQLGHRVKCPACESAALIKGEPHGQVSTEIDDSEVFQRQLMLPFAFECTACQIKITGYSKLASCGLGNTYTEKTVLSAAEYFELYTEDDLEMAKRDERSKYEYEPDNNE